MSETPRIAVSACLLGHRLRYDGGHKRHELVARVLAPALQAEPVCPESELGLGTPRPPMHIDAEGELRVTSTGETLTENMLRFSTERITKLPALSGYVFKSRSPSCAVASVAIGDVAGGRGLFARSFINTRPGVPVVEETELQSRDSVRHFVARVFAQARLDRCVREGMRSSELVAFHTAHKFSLLAHAGSRYKELGRMVASMDGDPPNRLIDDYRAVFGQLLAVAPSTGKYVDALLHALGYFKRCASTTQRDEMRHGILGILRGEDTVAELGNRISDWAQRWGLNYLSQQYFFGADAAEKELLQSCESFFDDVE